MGISAGDSLFDRIVHVSSPTKKAMRELIADEGVQSVVMELVCHGGVVDVRPSHVEMKVTFQDEDPPQQIIAEAAVLAAHVHRLSA